MPTELATHVVHLDRRYANALELGEDLYGCFLKDYAPTNW